MRFLLCERLISCSNRYPARYGLTVSDELPAVESINVLQQNGFEVELEAVNGNADEGLGSS